MLKSCPEDKPLRGWNNECYSCDTSKVVYISSDYYRGKAKQLEEVCPNRVILASVGGNPQSLLPCSDNRPLMDFNELCYSCSEELDIDLRFNEKLCKRFCQGKRYVPEEMSVCRACPQNKNSLTQKECLDCGGSYINNICY